MNAFLLAAAVSSLVVWGLHVFLGGKQLVPPLLNASDIPAVPKYTHYYCWHMVSIVLLAMPVGFVLAATRETAIELAVLMTVLAGAFSLWSVVLVAAKKQSPLLMPQWALFLPVTVFGVLGLVL